MAILKLTAIIFLSLISASLFVSRGTIELSTLEKVSREVEIDRLRSKAAEAKKYCNLNDLNQDFFFLVDLKRHSGLKRFYVWNFDKDTLDHSFLVSHGCGDNPWGKDDSKENATVSNEDGSHKSSVGKYIIGKRGYSSWGINVNYKLHGKDATNSNALKRLIVLHSWDAVPDEEVYPNGTPEGWGCPALSNSAMRLIDDKVRNSKKKVLLWVIQ